MTPAMAQTCDESVLGFQQRQVGVIGSGCPVSDGSLDLAESNFPNNAPGAIFRSGSDRRVVPDTTNDSFDNGQVTGPDLQD
jgi:hypothetical protein